MLDLVALTLTEELVLVPDTLLEEVLVLLLEVLVSLTLLLEVLV